MFGLAAPVWLAALAALAVPILLHLWSRRSRRVVRLGTLRHLSGAPAARALRLRVTEPLLLALRLATLTVLVLLLAEPFRRTGGDGETVALVAPSILRDAQALRDNPLLDSLRRAGTPVHLFAPGFATTEIAPAAPGDSAADADPWALLAEASRAFPYATALLVVSPATLSRESGPRPAIPQEVRWHDPGSERGIDRGFAWIAGDSVRTVVAENAGDGWTTARRVLTEPLAGASGTMAPIRVAIDAAPARAEDARYLTAALEALRTIGVPVVQVDPSPGALQAGDWLVRLGDGAPPEAVTAAVRRGVHLLSDLEDAGAAIPVSTAIASPASAGTMPLHLRSPAANDGTPWLRDAEGRALLSAARVGEGTHYRFHARFHPEWTGLVLEAGLPDLLLSLLAPDVHRALADPGPTRADPAELLPARRDAAPDLRASLHMPLLLLAAALFLVERLVATRRREATP